MPSYLNYKCFLYINMVSQIFRYTSSFSTSFSHPSYSSSDFFTFMLLIFLILFIFLLLILLLLFYSFYCFFFLFFVALNNQTNNPIFVFQ